MDALRSQWTPDLLYAFPPIPLIPKVIRKLLHEQVKIVLLASHWPRRSWFADLKTCWYHLPGEFLAVQIVSAGGSDSSRSPVAPADRLEIERCSLQRNNIPTSMIWTIQASQKPSTDRFYLATWRASCNCCDCTGVSALQASIVQVLMFLQDGLDRGLSPNTLRRQMAAILMVLTYGSLPSLS